MGWNQKQFDDFVVNVGVPSFSENNIKLKSGRMANWYINWRIEDAFLLNILVNNVLEFAQEKGLEPDTFYGVPEGATRLGVLVQDKWAKMQDNYGPGSHVIAMGRGLVKEHGDPKNKYFVGMPIGDTVVIEDVTTTGGSGLNTLDFLLETDVKVVGFISLSNRNEVRDDGYTVPQIMDKKGIKYYAMSEAINLMPKAAKKQNPPTDWLKKTEAYSEKYCTEKFRLI